MPCASFVVHSKTGEYFVQALQYKAILECIWPKLCSTGVKCEVPGVLSAVWSVEFEVKCEV